MNTYRGNAVAAGMLLVVATLAAIVGSALYRPFVGDPVDPTTVAGNTTPIFAGALLQLIGYAACPAIAIALYPVLRRYSEPLALGSVAFRVVEATFYSMGVIGLLLLVSVSQDAVQAGATGSSQFAQSAAVLLAGRDLVGSVAGVSFFALGGLLYYWVFFESAIVPRWLSGWGLIAAVMSLGGALLVLFQVVVPMSTGHILLNLPIAVQEMVLAGWLIVRGFDARVATAKPAASGSYVGAHAG
ncbi:MAG TPA: DUF4386 domain-containing protein [Candidatus Limnocylindrales bacterium]|nr:DUF4386 domain-containing protein [Candidatus Limnocylindrales bacterium]